MPIRWRHSLRERRIYIKFDEAFEGRHLVCAIGAGEIEILIDGDREESRKGGGRGVSGRFAFRRQPWSHPHKPGRCRKQNVTVNVLVRIAGGLKNAQDKLLIAPRKARS